MKKIRLLLIAAAAPMGWGMGLVQTGFAQPPNIVIIFNDDQGYQDLGC